MNIRGSHALDIIRVLAHGVRRLGLVRVRAPYSDRQIGRGGYQGGVVLGEHDVIDPMRVCLGLSSEGRLRFSLGLRLRLRVVGRCEGILGRLAVQIQMEVPRADDTVSSSRVAVHEVSKSSKQRRLVRARKRRRGAVTTYRMD